MVAPRLASPFMRPFCIFRCLVLFGCNIIQFLFLRLQLHYNQAFNVFQILILATVSAATLATATTTISTATVATAASAIATAIIPTEIPTVATTIIPAFATHWCTFFAANEVGVQVALG